MATFTFNEQDFRPLGEVLATEIAQAPTVPDVLNMMRIIRVVQITENHDEIIKAIYECFDFIGSAKYTRAVRETIESLEFQRDQIAEAATK